jgi:hypothetical protein
LDELSASNRSALILVATAQMPCISWVAYRQLQALSRDGAAGADALRDGFSLEALFFALHRVRWKEGLTLRTATSGHRRPLMCRQ